MIDAAIAFLGRLPWLTWPLLLALAWGGVNQLRVGSLEDHLAAEQADARAVLERTRATYAAAAAEAASAALAETARRLAAQKEAVDDAHAQAARARADAAAAADAGERLRQRFAAATAACRRPAGDRPAAAASSPPAQPAADLLADVLERVGEAAGQLALAADQSRVAGDACIRAYEALSR